MKRIEEPGRHDRTVLYQLNDGRMLRVDQDTVNKIGMKGVAEMYGIADEVPKERMPVIQRGREIGTVPGDFDPNFIKSKSPFYDPRPGDFVRAETYWIAVDNLGVGDLEAVPGFRRKHI